MNILGVISWGVLGAILAEVIKQSQKWQTLSEEKFRAQFKSLKFWAAVVCLMACGAISSYFLYQDAAGGITPRSCFAAGAGAQAFIRSLAASATAGSARRFGFGKVETALSWKDILS
jgi:hypothetical protein